MLNRNEIEFFIDTLGYERKHLLKFFRDQKINHHVLYRLTHSDDILQRREEFYSLFKEEDTADRWWSKIIDWILETQDGIYPLQKEKNE